jgi:hypothetical protein
MRLDRSRPPFPYAARAAAADSLRSSTIWRTGASPGQSASPSGPSESILLRGLCGIAWWAELRLRKEAGPTPTHTTPHAPVAGNTNSARCSLGVGRQSGHVLGVGRQLVAVTGRRATTGGSYWVSGDNSHRVGRQSGAPVVSGDNPEFLKIVGRQSRFFSF